MNRRQFLKTLAALSAAPGIVKADNIMKIWAPPEPEIITEPYSVSVTINFDEYWRIENKEIKYNEIEYIGPPGGPQSALDLYRWLQEKTTMGG